MRSLMSIVTLAIALGLAPLGGGQAQSASAEADEAVTLAKETLARKMRQETAGFELVSVEEAWIRVTGSRSVLRCEPPPPDDDRAVAGWRIRLRQGKDNYDLVVAGEQARLCNALSGERATPVRRTIERELAPAMEEAREDLARRLRIRPDSVGVVEAVSVVWPDSSAGCPQKGMAYTQVQTPGFRIRLTVGGRTYSYHGRDGEGPFLCGRPSGPEPAPAHTS